MSIERSTGPALVLPWKHSVLSDVTRRELRAGDEVPHAVLLLADLICALLNLHFQPVVDLKALHLHRLGAQHRHGVYSKDCEHDLDDLERYGCSAVEKNNIEDRKGRGSNSMDD